MRGAKALVPALLVLLAVGCDQGSPNRPSPPPPPPSPPDQSNDVPVLTGTVYETTPEGRRPLPGALLLVFASLNGSIDGTSMTADGDGRYTFTRVESGAAVLVHAFSGAGFYRHQPCVATAIVRGETVVDVEYNHKDVPGTGGAPKVSGEIFETTATGRRPVPDRQVNYYTPNMLAAHTITDANGRYEFCKVPIGAGRVFVTDPLDYDLGGPAAERTITVSGDVVVDLDIAK